MLPESNPLKVLTFTADQDAIVTGGGYYFGCRVTGGGGALGTAVVKDALTAAAATTVIDHVISTDTGAATGQMFPFGVRFNVGLSVDITTVGRVTIWYIPTGA